MANALVPAPVESYARAELLRPAGYGAAELAWRAYHALAWAVEIIKGVAGLLYMERIVKD
jgi:hypothetical protein